MISCSKNFVMTKQDKSSLSVNFGEDKTTDIKSTHPDKTTKNGISQYVTISTNIIVYIMSTRHSQQRPVVLEKWEIQKVTPLFDPIYRCLKKVCRQLQGENSLARELRVWGSHGSQRCQDKGPQKSMLPSGGNRGIYRVLCEYSADN